jgi:hypothetical protein
MRFVAASTLLANRDEFPHAYARYGVPPTLSR